MQYTTKQKEELTVQVEKYLADSNTSQSKFARMVDLSPAAISLLVNRKFDQRNRLGAGSIIVSDNALKKIEAFFSTGDVLWEIANYKKVFTVCMEAKKYKQQRIVDGAKGTCKTFTAHEFQKQVPHESFLVTCASDMTAKSFMIEVAKAVGVNGIGNRFDLRIRIGDRLLSLTDPVLVIDEAENLKDQAVGSIKDLYDYKNLYKNLGIVCIGANDFFETLNMKANRPNPKCFPQFISRFGLNPVNLENKTIKDTRKVCKYYDITDEDVIKEIHRRSQDYRQLDRIIQDYLKDLKLRDDDNGQSNQDA